MLFIISRRIKEESNIKVYTTHVLFMFFCYIPHHVYSCSHYLLKFFKDNPSKQNNESLWKLYVVIHKGVYIFIKYYTFTLFIIARYNIGTNATHDKKKHFIYTKRIIKVFAFLFGLFAIFDCTYIALSHMLLFVL